MESLRVRTSSLFTGRFSKTQACTAGDSGVRAVLLLRSMLKRRRISVSYTHLTLPTKA